MIFITQGVDEITASGIGRVLVEQCATQIHLANRRASPEDYIGTLKLTAGQFDALKALQPGQGLFLLVRETDSAVLQFPLHGLDEYIRVLSARESDLRAFNENETLEMREAAE